MNPKELVRRRRSLMRIMGNGGIAIIPSADVQYRNRDVDFPFRQDSDFMYLTGFLEPEAVAVLMPGRVKGEYILFCRERDDDKEVWYGRRAGPKGAVKEHAADDAFPISDIDEIIPGLLEQHKRVYYTLGRNVEFDQRLMGWVNTIRDKVRAGSQPPNEFISLDYLLHDQRLYKSRAEIALMRKAANVSIRCASSRDACLPFRDERMPGRSRTHI